MVIITRSNRIRNKVKLIRDNPYFKSEENALNNLTKDQNSWSPRTWDTFDFAGIPNQKYFHLGCLLFSNEIEGKIALWTLSQGNFLKFKISH